MKRFIKRVLIKLGFLKSQNYPYVDKTATVSNKALVYNRENLIMGEHSKIDIGSIIMNTNAKFIVKKYVGCAVNLTVITGVHPQFPGRFYRTISKKKEGLDISHYDKDVVVNEDVWIGCNVTLLPGVTIGRCSIVAAGAVVTKSQPPYCLIAGVPAKPIKVKWTLDEILLHERSLFPESERYTKDELLQLFTQYNLKVD